MRSDESQVAPLAIDVFLLLKLTDFSQKILVELSLHKEVAF